MVEPINELTPKELTVKLEPVKETVLIDETDNVEPNRLDTDNTFVVILEAFKEDNKIELAVTVDNNSPAVIVETVKLERLDVFPVKLETVNVEALNVDA